MLKKFLIIIITAFALYSCSDASMNLNEPYTDIENRVVEYAVDCPMTGVELVVNYTDRDGFVNQYVIKTFPWSEKVEISPLQNIRMLGYLRYVDKNVMLKYIDLKVKIDVENKYLNTGDTIYVLNDEEYIVDSDLRKNTIFSLEVKAIEDRVEEYLPQ